MFAHIDVQNEDIARKIPQGTIKWTSPWINSFVDGNGRSWDGVISHVALTTRPRIIKQDPFPTVAVATAQATATSFNKKSSVGFSLSRAGLIVAGSPAPRPLYPMAFSLLAGGIKLGPEDLIPKKKPEEKKPDARPTNKPPEKPADPGATPPPAVPGGEQQVVHDLEKALVDADGDISVIEVLIDLLESQGVTLPDGTTHDNFLERLYEAVMEKVKGGGGAMPPEPLDKPLEPNKPKQPPANPVVQESPPMYMSLTAEQVAAITDPEKKQMAEAFFSLQQKHSSGTKRTEALEKRVLDEGRSRRQVRIERLCQRVRDEGFKKRLLEQSASINLSLADDGSVSDPMQATLDLLEAGIKDMPALLLTPATALSVSDHPRDETGQMTEERRQEVVKDLDKHTGQTRIKAG